MSIFFLTKTIIPLVLMASIRAPFGLQEYLLINYARIVRDLIAHSPIVSDSIANKLCIVSGSQTKDNSNMHCWLLMKESCGGSQTHQESHCQTLILLFRP